MNGRSINLGWLNLGGHHGGQDRGGDYGGYPRSHFGGNHPSYLGRRLHDRRQWYIDRSEPNQGVLPHGGRQLFREEDPKENRRANQQGLREQPAYKRDAATAAIPREGSRVLNISKGVSDVINPPSKRVVFHGLLSETSQAKSRVENRGVRLQIPQAVSDIPDPKTAPTKAKLLL